MKKFLSLLLALCLLAGCLPMVASAASIITDNNNNDVMSAAQPFSVGDTTKGEMGDTINGEISKAEFLLSYAWVDYYRDDVDYYTFTLSSPGRVKAFVDANVEHLICLYNSSREHIFGNISFDASVYQNIWRTSYTFDLDAGTYFFRIQGYSRFSGASSNPNLNEWKDTGVETAAVWGNGNGAFSKSGKYTIETEFEPININSNREDSWNAPVQLSTGSVNGYLTLSNAADYYQVTLPEDGCLSLDLSWNPTQSDKIPSTILYNSGKTEMLTFGKSGKYDLHLLKGTYYLELSGSSNYETGSYTLKIGYTSANVTSTVQEPNNTEGQAKSVSLEQTVKGQLAINDDCDYYRFRPNSDTCVLNITLDFDTASVCIFDINRNPLPIEIINKGENNQVFFPTLTPGEWYYLKIERIKYQYEIADSYDTYKTKTGNYSFTLSEEAIPDDPELPDDKPIVGNFVDVFEGEYYSDAVVWAVDKNITSGTDKTHFSPNVSCTRAQAVTFLWRAAGEPEPAGTAASFKDVKAGSYYEKAVQWAVEQNITGGTGNGKFSPETACSRAQIVTFLWRKEGSPETSGSAFSDVKAGEYYETAVKWAVANEITGGTGNGKFSPDARCARGQIVTFLYRYAN